MADTDLTFREAVAGDANLLREWRNDPQTLEASGSTAAVNPAEHSAWLDRLLADPDRLLWVAEVDSVPIGQVRFERVRGYEYEVSVSVETGARGSGVGRAVIAGGCELLFARTNATHAIARVRAENAASAKAFEAAGFRATGEADAGWQLFVLARPDEWAPERPLVR